jgi:hypothetical protein
MARPLMKPQDKKSKKRPTVRTIVPVQQDIRVYGTPRISSRVRECGRRESQGLLVKVCVPSLRLSVGCRIHRVKQGRLFVPVSLPSPRVPSSPSDMQSSVLFWLGKETCWSFRGSVPLRKNPCLCTIAQLPKWSKR